LPVLVVLTLVGFVGSVVVARFASYEQKTTPPRPPTAKLAAARPDLFKHQARKPAAPDLEQQSDEEGQS